jgi:uncharacterized protein (DUF302 family)
MTDQGLITRASRHDAQATSARLREAITARGLSIFAEFDHAANAVAANLPLRATLVVVFGNAAAGTPIMQDRQTAGLDLPLKILVWEDEQKVTRLSWNDPLWIGARHGTSPGVQPTLEAMARLLDAVAAHAAGDA